MAVELPLRRYYRFMFLPGLLLVVVPSVIHAYLLMPFPGAQDMEAIGAAYFLEKILPYSLIIGGLLVIGPILNKILNGTLRGKLGVIFLTVFLIGVTYMANVKWSAEKMFVEPKQKIFANAAENKVPLDYLVVGIEHKGSARAYPINYIGYHHKVQDSVGGMPVLVTYCTMCRTAMVFNPIIDGAYQTFRLVGARHYNAVLEDAGTGSWWYWGTSISLRKIATAGTRTACATPSTTRARSASTSSGCSGWGCATASACSSNPRRASAGGTTACWATRRTAACASTTSW